MSDRLEEIRDRLESKGRYGITDRLDLEFLLAELDAAEARLARAEEALRGLLRVAEADLIGYVDCAACKAQHEASGEWWLEQVDGHEEDCPLYSVGIARAYFAGERAFAARRRAELSR